MGKAFIHSDMKNRNKDDLYETPYSMTRDLLDSEEFDYTKTVLEPATGRGAISTILSDRFVSVVSYDKEKNFFKESRLFDYVITNPPYNLADEFVEKARQVSCIKFAMLLRINFLSGEKRLSDNRYRNLRRVYVYSRMPDLRAPIRQDGKYPTGGIVYTWMVWEIGYKGKPEICFISNQNSVLKASEK
jgi:hypothetical protein